MWLLGRVLPLMVGHLVPEDDDKWTNLLLMLEITGYLFAPRLTSDEADYVALLIEKHHHAFCELIRTLVSPPSSTTWFIWRGLLKSE